MSRLTQDGTAKPISRDQILRRVRVQGNIHSLCSADHEQVWQSYPVDLYSDDFTYILYLHIRQYWYMPLYVVVVVVVVFTLKTVLTSIQYPSLSYSSRQRNEFPWSHANPK